MKKFIISLAALFLAATATLNAQTYEKNIFGVRAGLNISNMSMKMGGIKLSPDAKAGLNVGGSYQRLLTESLPLYLETGLYVSQYGCSLGFDDFIGGSNGNWTVWTLQVPLTVNYKFHISDFTLYPSAGLYYSFGFDGKVTYTDSDPFTGETQTVSSDLYAKDNGFSRSDFGLRFAANAEYRRIYFGLAYNLGLLNLNTAGDGLKATWGCFSISVGYNF